MQWLPYELLTLRLVFTEPPWSTQHQVDLVVASPEKGFTTVQPSETFREVIVALLNILIQPYTPEESDSTKTTTGTQTEEQTDPSAGLC